jgi:hypothetical protein
VAELLHHVAGREALVTPDFQSVEVEKLDSEGGDCGAEGRHFAPGGGEALCRNGARKKEKKNARQGRSKKKAKSHWCKALMACEALMAFMALMAVDGAASMGRPARLLLARGPH